MLLGWGTTFRELWVLSKMTSFSIHHGARPPNPGLPSEYHPRTRMTGLEVSTRAKVYMKSTEKKPGPESAQALGPRARAHGPRPLGPKGVGKFWTCFFLLIVAKVLHVLKPQGLSS